MTAVRIVAFVAGALCVYFTVGSAVRTVILPRGVASRLTRAVFVNMRIVFNLWAGPGASYERRDRVLALYSPVSLLATLVAWVTLVVASFTAMYWGLGSLSVRSAFLVSGSSVFTLGIERPPDVPGSVLAFTEAAIGLVLLALLITYLPSIYQAFSRREAAVTALEIRAGAPPSAVEMVERYWILERVEKLTDEWMSWEQWFVDIEETHTSFPALVFFRSPQPDHSWITAAGAVLDAASLILSTVDVPRDVQAEFCIRAGYLALRRIASYFGIPYDSDPKRGDPISIGRNEYDDVVARLRSAGVPLKADLDEAWVDFAGWRVNYDTVLVVLAGFVVAPYAPWSSDRSIRGMSPRRFRPPLRQRRRAA